MLARKADVDIRLFGHDVACTVDGREVVLPDDGTREVLAVLALNASRWTSLRELARAVEAPREIADRLQLALGPEVEVQRRRGWYRLAVPREHVDALRLLDAHRVGRAYDVRAAGPGPEGSLLSGTSAAWVEPWRLRVAYARQQAEHRIALLERRRRNGAPMRTETSTATAVWTTAGITLVVLTVLLVAAYALYLVLLFLSAESSPSPRPQQPSPSAACGVDRVCPSPD